MGVNQGHIWKKRKVRTSEASQIIGIIGAGRGMGTTHFCILMANYLCSGCGYRTSVLSGTAMAILQALGVPVQGQGVRKIYIRFRR